MFNGRRPGESVDDDDDEHDEEEEGKDDADPMEQQVDHPLQRPQQKRDHFRGFMSRAD